jgi:GxxExxY protein
MTELIHRELTERIISCFYRVYNTLGYGFLEKVYENALRIELEKKGLAVDQQHPIAVEYSDQIVGEYFADLIVEDRVIVEIKAVSVLIGQHEAQLLNYLKATKYEIGLVLNFGPSPKFIRRALSSSPT